MAVKSNLRGGGVGKRLLEEAFAFCDEKGYLRIKLVRKMKIEENKWEF